MADVESLLEVASRLTASLLIDGDLEGLEVMTSHRDLSAAQLGEGVAAVGGLLVEPPETEWKRLRFTQLADNVPGAFGVVVPLWIASGRSSYGLELRLIPTSYGTYHVEIVGFV